MLKVKRREFRSLLQIFSGPDIVKTIKLGRLLCAGYVIRMLGGNLIKKSPKSRWKCTRVSKTEMDGWNRGLS
jgi:hypothetical protein